MINRNNTYRLVLLIATTIFCDLTVNGQHPWAGKTAYALRGREKQIGLFQRSRLGIGSGFEINTNILANVVNPNVGIKKQWKCGPKLSIASQHSISYPTPLLKTISRRGPGGLIPFKTEVPRFFNFKTELLFSHNAKGEFNLNERIVFHERISVTYSKGFGNNTMVTIDYPILYPETSIYHNNVLFDVGGSLIINKWGPKRKENNLIKRVLNRSLRFDLDVYFLAQNHSNVFLHQKTFYPIHIKSTENRHNLYFNIGYLATFGNYPFGKDISIFPMVDLVWSKRRDAMH